MTPLHIPEFHLLAKPQPYIEILLSLLLTLYSFGFTVLPYILVWFLAIVIVNGARGATGHPCHPK